MRKRQRRKRRPKKPGQSLAALKKNGLKAFNNGSYYEAIVSWTKNPHYVNDKQLVTAIAEAYFRLSLEESADGYDNLETAVSLQPNDGRYLYHLGLVANRQGKLDEAITAYEKAYGMPAWQARVAYPFALVWQQQTRQAITDAPSYPSLTKIEKEMLAQAQAFQKRPYKVTENAAPLWQGLGALAQKNYAEAETHLTKAAQSSPVNGITHYYLGTLAAQAEAWEKTAHHWSAAHQAGFNTLRLTANSGELYHRLAEERLQNQDFQGALLAATEAAIHKPEDKHLQKLLSHLAQQAGYQAAQQGKWEEATNAWEMAQEKGGATFRISYNLALAYEKMEHHIDAAQQWRETLRRRPRKANAMSDQQIGRLWQRAAEAYIRAGEYNEAVNVYKHAVKWQPANLDMRMALTDGLLNNGQFQAALNEIDRVLERNPDHIAALIKAGEIHAQNEHWWYHSSAIGYWERALTLEPNNETVKQHLSDYYMDRAEYQAQWGHIESVIESYEQALHYQPDNGAALAELAYAYHTLDEEEETEAYIEQALQVTSHNEEMYERLIITRLSMGQVEKANELGRMAEANITNLSPFFYIVVASNCLLNQRPDVAKHWLAQAIEKAPAELPILVVIGERLVSIGHQSKLAVEIGCNYLRQAIKKGQYPGQARLMLGIVAAQEEDMRTAKKEWKQAKKLARKDNDEELLQRIAHAEAMFSSPFGLLSQMMGQMMEGELDDIPLPPHFLDMLGNMLDEDDDDEFYF
ncbi:MAG: tetratricopeptide repeat protein [Chloroflexi bacterium]|nr:tetratricopeptide repeat protein [Chloroflexota bacterium]